MSKVLVNENNLMAIGAAIRERNGTATTYRPGDMAAAIQAVPNRYGASDEGKVVSSGALVAQTSATKTANGTYDTTTNNEVVVDIAPNLQSKTATQNGTVTPDQGYDGLSSVVVNVSGGGGLTPMVVTPTVHEASFIGGNGYLSINNSSYPDYRFISVELSQFAGKLIRIINTGNRNYWGLYSRVTDGQRIEIVGSRQSTNGELIFYADDWAGLPNVHYLVYDFTSSAQSAPIIEMYDIEL